MENTGTAVAVRPPSDDEIQNIRARGHALVAQKREQDRIAKMLEGTNWGRGMNAVARASVAEFCRVVKADPHRHVDVLGNKLYLNADYWTDKVTADPLFHHYVQDEVGPEREAHLRLVAENLRSDAQRETDPAIKAALIEDYRKARRDADAVAEERAKWGPPAFATHVVVTTIYRFMNQAPMDLIRAGKEDPEKWLVKVQEANWAGGMGRKMAEAKKFDPIGDANPSTTARTRSLRRCGVKAFSAWMAPYEQQVKKAEEIIEAEFTIVEDDSDRSAVGTGNGEPEAASGNGARALPVRGEPDEPKAIEGEIIDIEEDEGQQEPPFDATDARKKLFATLRDCGIKDKDRKAWAKANGLPESTQKWGKAEYEKAMTLLMDPLIDEVEALALELQVTDLGDLALEHLGKDTAVYASDYVRLRAVMQAEQARRAAEPVEDEDL